VVIEGLSFFGIHLASMRATRVAQCRYVDRSCIHSARRRNEWDHRMAFYLASSSVGQRAPHLPPLSHAEDGV